MIDASTVLQWCQPPDAIQASPFPYSLDLDFPMGPTDFDLFPNAPETLHNNDTQLHFDPHATLGSTVPGFIAPSNMDVFNLHPAALVAAHLPAPSENPLQVPAYDKKNKRRKLNKVIQVTNM